MRSIWHFGRVNSATSTLPCPAAALADRGRLSSLGFNELAWDALFHGTFGPKALDDAQKAVTRTLGLSGSALHTLATVEAESGKAREALEDLLRSIEARNGEPNDQDWFVVGRIAEQYGLSDAAVALYRKLSPPKNTQANTPYVLAQKRLKKLAK